MLPDFIIFTANNRESRNISKFDSDGGESAFSISEFISSNPNNRELRYDSDSHPLLNSTLSIAISNSTFSIVSNSKYSCFDFVNGLVKLSLVGQKEWNWVRGLVRKEFFMYFFFSALTCEHCKAKAPFSHVSCEHSIEGITWMVNCFKNYFIIIFLIFNFNSNKLYPNSPLIKILKN